MCKQIYFKFLKVDIFLPLWDNLSYDWEIEMRELDVQRTKEN